MSQPGEKRKFDAREDHNYQANGHQVPSIPDTQTDASLQPVHPEKNANQQMSDLPVLSLKQES